MVRVNLLPHRAIKRAEQQRQFGIMAFIAAALAGLLVFLYWSVVTAQKEAQDSRNKRLDDEIAKLEIEIKDIKKLKGEIGSVLERKQIVENLQTNRSQAVVILDEIARRLPDGMFIKSLKQQGNTIRIEGVADTNARVATLVRTLTSSSEGLENPKLVEIKSNTVNNLKQNDFVINVSLKAPQVDAQEVAKAGKAKAK